MRTTIPIAGPTCLSAVQAYIKRLQEDGGLPVELCEASRCEEDSDGDRVVCVEWNTDTSPEREAWDADDDEPADSRPTVSTRTAAQYHRNLVLLGTQEPFAAAWLSGQPASRKGRTSL